EDFSGEGILSDIEISDKSSSSGLTINAQSGEKLAMKLADGVIINGNASANISVSSVENSITETVDPGVDQEQLKTMVNGYMYVIPSTFADKNNVQFALTIDNKVYTISHPGEGELIWLKGYQYIYKLRLTTTSINIVGIIITDWDVNYGGNILIK
ncbi:MAG: fimbrillin family protein, partial [Bacteroidales bacterium]|nr:fimbrillin family protein [Bacteroidales bacterium]